uniref:Uncharacterized protein n=1 Tax=Anguilla anguilla TaxID=7936 RepID=A0A0E9X2W4_ANGAN
MLVPPSPPILFNDKISKHREVFESKTNTHLTQVWYTGTVRVLQAHSVYTVMQMSVSPKTSSIIRDTFSHFRRSSPQPIRGMDRRGHAVLQAVPLHGLQALPQAIVGGLLAGFFL